MGWNLVKTATTYMPGNFIPAIRRAKLGLPICLNIFFICAYCRSRLLTSCTLVPEPRAMRFRRLPLMASFVSGHRIDDGLDAVDLFLVNLVGRFLQAGKRADAGQHSDQALH